MNPGGVSPHADESKGGPNDGYPIRPVGNTVNCLCSVPPSHPFLPMTPVLAALAVCVAAVNPDPKALAPSADQLAQARSLVKRLGSPAYRVREAASRDLAKLGRAALPALAEAVATATDPEVRARVELLLPKVTAADLQARLAAFRADADGRFDHELPGWSAMRERAGSSPDARRLFADMWANKPTADLLAALDGPADVLGRKLDARRAELYQTNVRFNPAGQRAVAQPADLAALLLLDGLAPPAAGRAYNPTWYLLQQQPVKDLVSDDARPAFRKLLAGWMDGRAEPNELYQAMMLAARLDRKELPPVRYAAKLLENQQKGTPAFYRMYALTVAAKDGAAALPLLAKGLEDRTSVRAQVAGPAGQLALYEIQVRDVALAMSVLASGGKPEEFGFENSSPGVAANGLVRANYTQYRFADEAKRDAAFKKWATRK